MNQFIVPILGMLILGHTLQAQIMPVTPKVNEVLLPQTPPVPVPPTIEPTPPAKSTEPLPLGPMARLLNMNDVRTKLGLVSKANPNVAKIKIAVLDFGFEGCDPRKLGFPAGSVLVEHYPAEWIKANNLGDPEFQKGFEPGNPHGRLMAQSAWAVAGGLPQGPIFYLLNANGPTLFRRAVKYAIEQQVHIILFSAHFEGGGNYDGRGSINTIVDDAIQAGIIWINAAGNHRGRVYNGSAVPAADGYLRFGMSKQSTLKFTNRLDENTFTITLTWNSYADQEDAGTTKNLDLYVETLTGKLIGKAELKQITSTEPTREGESKNPRERLTLPTLGAGTYQLRIKATAGKFTDKDRIRVLLSPSRGEPYPHPDTGKLTDPVQFIDGSKEEELFPPADHPRVITVGEVSEYSAQGPTADRRLKPDVLLPFLPAKWSNGEVAGGTSYSAAYFAGLVAAMKADQSTLTANDLMGWFSELRRQIPKPKGKITKPEPAFWKMPTAAEMAKLKKR